MNDQQFEERPQIAGTERVQVYYSHAGQRWFAVATMTRGDTIEFDIKGPRTEAAYRGVVGIVRAIAMAMSALGAALDG